MLAFRDIVEKRCAQQGRTLERASLPLLAFDPGHTTGWAYFSDMQLMDAGQLRTKTLPDATKGFMDLLQEYKPAVVVYEDYRVYRTHREQHVGSQLLTVQVIGSLETCIALYPEEIHIVVQGAGTGKSFCKDDKLKAWGFFQLGAMRHANDAVRHGAHWILFGELPKKASTSHRVG